MNRKGIAIWLSFVLVFSFIAIIVEIAPVVEAPTTWYVDDVPGSGAGNPPEDFTSIQDAINTSQVGDTIFVYNGTYYENIVVNKTINLTGEDRNNTILIGSGNENVMYVIANWVNISGFKVTNGGLIPHAGISLNNVKNCRLVNNNVPSNDCYGIYVLQSSENDIIGNNISLNLDCGIRLEYSTRLYITDNTISNNDYGISVLGGHGINIQDNIISNNDGGIHLYSIVSTIIGNTMMNNGIFIEGLSLDYWNTHNIDTSNTVNGKPVYYWKNRNGGTIPSDAGQVILANCTNVVIENQNLYNASIGVELGFSSNNIVVNNIANSNYEDGIFLYFSNNNTIANNTCSNNRYGIFLESSSINVIENNNCSSGSSGIYFSSSDNNIIEGNILNNNGFGIYFYDSDYNIIGNNSCSLNSLYGIYIYMQSDENVLENNTCLNNEYGIHLHWYSDHNTIENNNCSNNSNGIYFSSSVNEYNVIKNNDCSYNDVGIHLTSGNNNNMLENNIFSGNYEIGIYLSYSSNKLYANRMENSGIYVDGDKSTFTTQEIPTNNTVNGKPVYYYKNVNMNNASLPSDAGQIILGDVSWLRIENVDVSSATAGFQIGYSSDIDIANSISFPNFLYGIRILYSSSIKIYNTDCLDTKRGIYLEYSSNSTIESCNCSNDSYGIYLKYSDQNIIKDNNCLSSNRGIHLDESSNNIIKNNTCSNNDDGIYLSSFSSNNIIYHNNILSNTNQAYDHGTNRWDNGYPLGGNYWSDYSGVDNYKGPNQNILGKDGIGDTPYTNIGGSAGAKDNYPLMAQYKPFENYTVLKLGWNLISTPLIQDEQNLTRVLGSIDGWYDAVQWYDVTDTSDPWKHYKVGKPFGNDMSGINETKGFWIHITQPGDTIFLYNGTQPTSNQTIILHPGWNLVGYPSLISYNRTAGLNNLTFGQEVNSIWTYYAATQKWKEIGPSDYFELGRGYWIHAKTTCVWEVPL